MWIIPKKRRVSVVTCFWNHTLEKIWFLECLKILASEHFLTVNMLKGPKHCFNLHSSIFVNFFITLKEIQPEKICLSSFWALDTVCQHIHSRWLVLCLRKSGCLMQPIQMRFSRNGNTFSNFFWHFRNLHKILNTLKKNMNLRRDLFLKL